MEIGNKLYAFSGEEFEEFIGRIKQIVNPPPTPQQVWRTRLKDAYYLVGLVVAVVVGLVAWDVRDRQIADKLENTQLRIAYEKKTTQTNELMFSWMSAMNGNFREVSGIIKVVAPELREKIRSVDNRQDKIMQEIKEKEKEF